jgi:CheY-like chemotaxis protein
LLKTTETFVKTIETMLRSAGHEVVSAADGDNGIRRFREQKFDLVLCDVHMPGKGGHEVIEEIRRSSNEVPIIWMSGSSGWASGGAHLDPAFLRAGGGATKVITKPFRAHEILALVRELVEP